MIDGKKIIRIRKEKGLSRAALARETGIPLRTLENWESGAAQATGTDRINKLCDALECNIAELYDDEVLRAGRLHEEAAISSMLRQDCEESEIEILECIQRIYDIQGITGILKVIDRMIYRIGQEEALEIIKEQTDESS
ncbi:XRE family transcriptional regulator [Clostridium sp. AF15-17LB]|nr:XRE family transcriptional regulator [Clostridium sp. AF15-17LB]